MYLNDWKNGGFDEMVRNFNLNKDDLRDVDILLASYCDEWGLEGDAFVLFRHDGRLFEVNGSHCSCHGLEGQWNPEETTKEALLHRIDKGSLGNRGNHHFSKELRELLESI